MANTVTNINNLSLRSILEKDKLIGPNFLDWERNLMIALRHERKWYVLEEPLGEAPPANAPAAVRNAHKTHSDDLLDVACLMLATMGPDLQTGLINTNAYDMIRQLRDMFQTQARTERYGATKAFNECKMIRGTSVSDHVMKMKRHMDHLERLGHPVLLQLATDTILNSLSEDYKPFVINYNMNNVEKSIAELHSMLKTAELNMGAKNKTKDVLMVRDGGVKKKHGHGGTNKGKGPVQAIQSAPRVRENIKGKGKGKKVKPNKARTENRCFTCNEIGHWRQNCPKRHEADSARTEVVGASEDALRGSSGSPGTVNITTAVQTGRESTSLGLFSSTGAHEALGIVPSGPGLIDSSKVSKNAHATPRLLGLTDSGGIPKTTQVTPGLQGSTDSDDILKVVQSRIQSLEEANVARDLRVEALEKALAEIERKRREDLEASRKQQEDRDRELYEIKRKLKGKHVEEAPSTEAPIPRQSEDVLRLAPPTSGTLPHIPSYVTEAEHEYAIASYTTQNDRLSAQVQERDALVAARDQQIELLQRRIRELEAACRSQAQPSKRRHDDPDDSTPSPHEGEVQATKRLRIDFPPASGSGSSSAPATTTTPPSAPSESAAISYEDSDAETLDVKGWHYESIPLDEVIQFPHEKTTVDVDIVPPESAPTDPNELQIPEEARKILRSLAQSLRIYKKGDEIASSNDYNSFLSTVDFPTSDAPHTITTSAPDSPAPTVIQLNWNHSVIFRPFLEEFFSKIYQQEKLHVWSRKVYLGISHFKKLRRRTAYVHQRIGTGVPAGELQDWTFTKADLDRIHLEDLLALIKYLQGPILRPKYYPDGLEVLKRYVRHTITLARVTDYQLAIESHQPKVNLLSPNLQVPVIISYHLYLPSRVPEHGVVYLTRKKKERKFMRFSELAQFCDGTLLYVYNGLKSRLLTYQIPPTKHNDGKAKNLEAMRLIEEKLQERLMYRRVEAAMRMRARMIGDWEEFLQLSK
ncbi:hypothetical protein OSB04_013137 [Centaurea solstitialis]|uniref:CCHC-type domain-containing protein n=1 Tax=Centaurea solstitialis TaxID=347529 RepID=A0AA38TCP3_9ASTR|nr:hypothetical protein OSB04_013137 [Centaurea solstitialis]